MSNTHYAKVQATLLEIGDRIKYPEGIATVTGRKTLPGKLSDLVSVGLWYDYGDSGEAIYRTTDMITLEHDK